MIISMKDDTPRMTGEAPSYGDERLCPGIAMKPVRKKSPVENGLANFARWHVQANLAVASTIMRDRSSADIPSSR